MSYSRLTNNLRASREALEKLTRIAYQELGLPLPDRDTSKDIEILRRYLSGNPDITPQKLAEELAQANEKTELSPNVIDLTTPATRSILNKRVRDIEGALTGFDTGDRYRHTCFGTIPGCGLDAYCFKIDRSNEYAVVIPDGFFHLTNLMTKLVILLHPITPSAEGPIFMPSAPFEQMGLMQHPYVMFRQRDLLEAFFLWGEPQAALPYTRAIPYQDRFAYLLVGTELFVLAHELAHIILGHLDRQEAKDPEELEFEADELALKIVTAYFSSTTNYPVMRASLCGLLFISMINMWETGLERLMGDSGIAKSHTHPVSSARFERYASFVKRNYDSDTPDWYIHTYNAINGLTVWMLPDALHYVNQEAKASDGVSARVLPRSHQYLGHLNSFNVNRWWLKLANMLSSKNDGQRRIGLWLFVNHLPNSAIGLYRGIVNEDVEVQESCEAALISIEPMYAAYIPRLKERYRETAKKQEFDDYLLNLSAYLGAVASVELGAATEFDPMDPRFLSADNRKQNEE